MRERGEWLLGLFTWEGSCKTRPLILWQRNEDLFFFYFYLNGNDDEMLFQFTEQIPPSPEERGGVC